ncbi:aminodeoxychorismate synthase component I [Arcobacter ellisii]|uniref:Aminodeoxychorismate synthase component I n=1 Tax=Arcobacter ellisii TaxID=913109 RepID=A0A347U5H5_9BACT|nr:aminodeoxychorismate synthase component I [Arcobacter ellisii]AXX94103.1 aminodeoxychorismate synthase, component I [Arcobacter ellisii]RXI32462.1 aminodeoxychorismate synthase component I [Arcobacter ellisii]
MSKELIKEKLNKFGFEKEPFLFVISYDFSKFYIEKLSNLSDSIKYQLDNKEESKQNIQNKISLEKFPISFKEYKKKFDILQKEIKKGNSYLLNLTAKTKIKTTLSLDEIYENTKSRFKLRFKNQKDDFVCFSPERFIKIEDNNIFTYPMKGTIDAKFPNAKEKILTNQKEMAEHTMVVDLLRNDLGIVGSNVRVEDFRYIETINAGDKELLQVSSKISAKLENNWSEKIGDILTSILPAGSITGTPKKKTVEILKDVENYERDFYTGIFGVYDGKNLDSSVMIRFIEEKDGEKFYKSGGGITCDSDVFLEYEELLDKVYLPF